MNDSEVIIIGGGASGLIAARELSKNKKKVMLLEGRERLGGRIHTFTPQGFSGSIEAGAEFIHGDLPITLSLLKEAGIPFYNIEGETYRVKEGRIRKSEEIVDGFSVLEERVKQLKKDIPFSEFLEEYLKEENLKETKESAVRFIEGYDAADINKASTFALSEEWGSEGVSSPYRIEGGYQKIIGFLYNECIKLGVKIFTSAIVKEIKLEKKNAEIMTGDGALLKSNKVLVTIPAGVLNSSPSGKAFIKFFPEIKDKREAFNSIGYGPVIKVFFEFKDAFWESDKDTRKVSRPGFIITDTLFTAWWSQLPKKIPLLTGWFAGPNVDKMDLSNKDIIGQGISALCRIFDAEKIFVQNKIKSAFAANWKEDPFSLGAYSYATVETAASKRILNEPVENIIFFAGEALSEDQSMGTVEAAFASGLAAAKKILEAD
ncbi:MAG TPA: NAD(P)/FAD-dependent oxidoreductase [Ignavibacteriaceae bacterium]|nr:NAD(P)/FAD-dependent oxidoreductase [Ignavibacteriaceae bacterium]